MIRTMTDQNQSVSGGASTCDRPGQADAAVAEALLKSIIETVTSERTMELWDAWRAMLLDGDLGDAPRLGFESVLSAVQSDAEDALAALRAAVPREVSND